MDKSLFFCLVLEMLNFEDFFLCNTCCNQPIEASLCHGFSHVKCWTFKLAANVVGSYRLMFRKGVETTLGFVAKTAQEVQVDPNGLLDHPKNPATLFGRLDFQGKQIYSFYHLYCICMQYMYISYIPPYIIGYS